MSDQISPIGSSLEEVIARRMRDPAYRAAYLEMRVAHAIARVVIIGRVHKHWSQARLAREIGTSASVISRLESGSHKVSVETLRRIANALGVSFVIDPDPAYPSEPAAPQEAQ
jgi:ribosome-binding protein aMBF1 (putative translation factor)